MSRNRVLTTSSVLALALSVAPAFVATAQEESGDSDARRLQTVVVSSQKREQTLQDVPIAVSVTDADTIEKAQIQDINDLQTLVPSLRVTQLQSSAQTNFVIRGFGNGANAIGVEPSVGVFIDGVYRSRSAAQIADLPNVTRVEVLRGPQSTLFGKNASAGVISVVTAAPQFEFGGGVEATLGNFNQQILKANVTGPISEQLAFSLSGQYNKRDGYIDNLANGGELNERNRWGLRGQLLFEPSETVSFRLIADYDQIDEECCGAPNIVSGPASAIIESLGGGVNPGNPFDYESFIDRELFNEIENSGISLEGNFEFDGATLTTITAFRNNQLDTNVDIDFTSAQIFNDNLVDSNIDTFTQEVRLTSTGDQAVDWLIGAFYFDETVERETGFSWGPDARGFFDTLLGGPATLGGIEAAFMIPAGTFFADGSTVDEELGQDNEAISIFGQLDWHINDRMTATVGANYTKDEKAAFFRQVRNDNVFDSLPLAPLAGLQFFPPLIDFPNSVEDGESSDEDVTYTLRLAGDVTDNINVYASAATGFKATSWNLTRDGRPFASDEAALTAAGLIQPNQTFSRRFTRPEQASVLELGAKGQFANFAFNVALFDQEIEDYQTAVFTGSGFDFQNAQLSVKGFEFDATWSPVDPLTLTVAGTLLDPEFESAVTVGGATGSTKPAGIHETSLSTSALYEFALFQDWDAYVRADYLYESDTRVAENVPADVTREVNSANASAGFTTQDGWGVQIWGRNIFGDEYLLSAFPSPGQSGNFNGYPNAPTTYGVTVSKTF